MSIESSGRYKALKKLEKVSKTEFGLEGRIDKCKFRIWSYSTHTIRINITNKKRFDEVSYAVVAQPQKDIFTYKEKANEYSISTEEIGLTINKELFRLGFHTSSGKVINEDEPGLGMGWMNAEAIVHKKLQEDERFVGLGEKTGNLDRRGTGLSNWNTDAFGYGPDTDPIYASIPFYIGIHSGLVYGLFVDNSYKSHFNFGASNNRFSSFATEGGDINYYLIYGRSIKEVLHEYGKLTGFMELPPIWSLGYQQCRYSYYPEAEVVRTAQTFREKQIPADVIYLDIHYMDKYKVFTWDKNRFPDPQALKSKLASMGFKLVVITDPGVKTEEGYEPYDEGAKKDLFLKYPDGSNYEGEVWPGWCAFPDFTKKKARKYWSKRVANLLSEGVDGIWNDMNEIATWGQKLPDVIDFDYEGETSSSKRGRNVYGMQMARSAYEGCKKANSSKRPFVLTRAGFSGIQRYSALWTGDNVSYDDHMLLGVRLVNSLGLSGVAYAGYDVGGFVGESSPALFARWIAIGAFSPLFRGHTMINSRDAEPWSFGEEVEEISRNYISLRYRLLPYIYSLFYEASKSGVPVSRSLAIEYPHDNMVYDEAFQNQYLFGPSFLVAPVKGDQTMTKVYLPMGQWYDMHTDDQYSGDETYYFDTPLDRIPTFVKAGAIVPMQSLVQHTDEQTNGILEVHYYYQPSFSSFECYQDAGDGYEHLNGDASIWRIEVNGNAEIMINEMIGGNKFLTEFESIKLIVHGFPEKKIKVNGKEYDLTLGIYTFLEPISNFDPFIKIDNKKPIQVKTALIPLNDIGI